VHRFRVVCAYTDSRPPAHARSHCTCDHLHSIHHPSSGPLACTFCDSGVNPDTRWLLVVRNHATLQIPLRGSRNGLGSIQQSSSQRAVRYAHHLVSCALTLAVTCCLMQQVAGLCCSTSCLRHHNGILTSCLPADPSTYRAAACMSTAAGGRGRNGPASSSAPADSDFLIMDKHHFAPQPKLDLVSKYLSQVREQPCSSA
jgi:hypothetical protein